MTGQDKVRLGTTVGIVTVVGLIVAVASLRGAGAGQPVPGPSITPGTWSYGYPTEPIVFAADGRAHPYDTLFAVGSDGSGLQHLARAGEHPRDPSWSPDGSRLAFFSSDGLEVWRPSEGYPVGLSDAGARWFDWSPDGSRVVIARSWGAGGTEIYTLDSETSRSPELIGQWEDVNAAQLAWSPSGDRIAFSVPVLHIGFFSDCGIESANGIYILHLGSKRIERLTDGGCDHSPAWSPDGERIAFVRDHGIFIMDGEGRDTVQVAGCPGPSKCRGWHRDVAWSPDGKELAFTREWTAALGRSKGGLWVIGANGEDPLNILADEELVPTYVDWRPTPAP